MPLEERLKVRHFEERLKIRHFEERSDEKSFFTAGAVKDFSLRSK
jgi:hypothetical protein